MAKAKLHPEQEKQMALAMRAAGYSYTAIARKLGRSHHTIQRWIEAASDEERALHDSYRRRFVAEAWGKIFAAMEALTAEKIERANARDLVWCIGVLFDKTQAVMGNALTTQEPQEQATERRPEVRIVVTPEVMRKLEERRKQEQGA